MSINYEQAGRSGKSSSGSPRFLRLAGLLVGILFFTLPHLTGDALGATLSTTYSVALAWTPSPSTNTTGCQLYYGSVSGVYTNSIYLGDVTNVTASGLSYGATYYFAVTVLGVGGYESVLSGEISCEQNFPGAQLQFQGMSGGQSMLAGTGQTGHTYDIQATEDCTNWTVIGTVTMDASGLFDFTDTNAANFPLRFYRTHDTSP